MPKKELSCHLKIYLYFATLFLLFITVLCIYWDLKLSRTCWPFILGPINWARMMYLAYTCGKCKEARVSQFSRFKHLYLISSRCPIARHRTVSARPRTLLVYEGNKSHVIKNMAATVKSRWTTPYSLYHVTRYLFYILYCTVSRYRTAW